MQLDIATGTPSLPLLNKLQALLQRMSQLHAPLERSQLAEG